MVILKKYFLHNQFCYCSCDRRWEMIYPTSS